MVKSLAMKEYLLYYSCDQQ